MNGRREHPPETVFAAQELYCVDRLTFDQVAKRLGVAASTLKRWAETYGWKGKREEIAKAEADIRADTVLARSQMLKALIETRDPQTGFAVAGLESLALKQAEAARLGRQLENAAVPRQLREIKTEADAVAALEEALAIRMSQMLSDPSLVDLKTVRELRQAVEMVRGMRAEALAPTGARKKGVSLEATEAVRRKILGVKG